MNQSKILFVVTSHASMTPSRKKTGLWLGEFLEPFRILSSFGLEIAVASPMGGTVPIDPKSLESPEISPEVDVLPEVLQKTQRLDMVHAQDFDAVFYPGGHGPLWDLAYNPVNLRLLREFWKEEKFLSAVCHGPAAFLGAPEILKDRRMTAFSDVEENLVGLDKTVPFSLQQRLQESGAFYSCEGPWSEYIVCDDFLITGQNPQSAAAVARALAERLN